MSGFQNFCGKCGNSFGEQGFPKSCSKCQNVAYGNPTPVSVLLQPIYDELNNRTGVLIITRGIEPFIGGKALPGGFVDNGESAETAAIRELKEETGIVIDSPLSILTTSVTGNNNLLIFCVAEKTMTMDELHTHFTATHEALSFFVAWTPETLCFPLHTDALKKWFDGQTPAATATPAAPKKPIQNFKP